MASSVMNHDVSYFMKALKAAFNKPCDCELLGVMRRARKPWGVVKARAGIIRINPPGEGAENSLIIDVQIIYFQEKNSCRPIL